MDRESAGHVPFCSSAPHLKGLCQRVPCPHWTPNCGWIPLGVGTPPLPQPPPRGARSPGPLLLLPLPSLPLPQDPRSWRRPWWAEDQAQDLSRLLGAQVGGGDLSTLPFDPLPSQWSHNLPLQVWDPFPSPSHPSGAPVPSHLHFSSPLIPPNTPRPTWLLGVPPVPLGVRGHPLVPGRCPGCGRM